LTSRQPIAAALVALPGILTVYFGFNAGGFFVGSQALVAVVLLVILALRVTTDDDPFAGISAPLALAAGALAAFAVWTLVSAAWSDAPSRALLEFDRALLYLAALVLFGSFVRAPERLRWMLRLTALGIAVLCVVALITRVLPDVWPVSPNLANNRLSYPLTYWNALGLLSSIGLVLGLHLATSGREPGAARVLSSALMPALAVTLLFTFSRGAIAAFAVAVLAYVLVARPKALLGGLLAVVPACGVAVAVAYSADLLATDHPTTPQAVAQGHRVALTVLLCAVGAAVVRGLLLRLDDRAPLSILPAPSRRLAATAAAAVLSLAIAFGVIVHAPAAIGRQYDHFVGQAKVEDSGDSRQRLIDPSNSHRLELWRVDLHAFKADELKGHGAGTFQVVWAQHRPNRGPATDGHSIYLETLAELGIVGFLMLMTALLTVLVGLAARCRGQDRAVYAAVLAAALAWALQAGIDWDWEMPVVTLWIFALGGAALAASNARGRLFNRAPARFTRVVMALAVLALAVTPARIAVSQARLTSSVEAFKRGDCGEAIDAALSSASAAGMRPEPYEVLGYCDSRLGLHQLAIREMHSAVERDPEAWEFRYGLAVVRAAAGRDPRRAARAALRLNPRGLLAGELVRMLATPDPQTWRKRGRTAPPPGDL
jgi:O-antigen ligase